jgi:histidyl-tRNA synthetase
MESVKVLRGFRDVYGDEIERFSFIEAASRKYLKLLGYKEIEIPVLEKTELFKRSIGDTTDIVEKEMFTFVDRSGDSVTMRPEGTAGVVRAYLQGSFHARERISKLFTMGPMFRHERPQKGRFRQFYQMDVEVFGVAESMIDAELIWMISLILGDLGVAKYAIEINSVGCKACREGFRGALVGYLGSRRSGLCEDCQNRLDRNPLRVFDCKNEGCGDVIKEAPVLFDYLCAGCKEHFDACLDQLARFGVPAVLNKRLVRGLDYYTRTVFEVTSNDLGAQKAFLAGGRYDDLVEEMGGPSVPGCGFAIGMERLSMLIPCLPARTASLYFLATVGEKAGEYVIPILRAFTSSGIRLSYALPARSLKSQMKYANSLGVDYVMILGEEEVSKGVILVRDMKDGTQRELLLEASSLPGALTGG